MMGVYPSCIDLLELDFYLESVRGRMQRGEIDGIRSDGGRLIRFEDGGSKWQGLRKPPFPKRVGFAASWRVGAGISV